MQYARKLRVKKDQIVVKQGTKGRKVYVVAMGFLTASINGRPTRTLTVSDMFGDVEALFGKIYSATYRTSTEVELLEFPALSLKKTLGETGTLQDIENLAKMQAEDSWEALNSNSTIESWSALKLRLLQSILYRKAYKKGDILWKAGDRSSIAVLVAKGKFRFEGNQNYPFAKGAFIGEVDQILAEKEISTTLRCTKSGYCFVMKRPGLQKFFDSNPGTLLQFVNRNFVE
mmetsp:Transcript_5879/g.8702  ORF Transcript_5879/g.8702 Transcript_5879/m.8702 type:complete len:230 (-) Transcript_5879:140-829(-)